MATEDTHLAEVPSEPAIEADEVGLENKELIGSIPVAADTEGVSGGAVLEHVLGYATALCGATGACAISTYDGHDPDKSRALDILVSADFGFLPADFSLGDSVAAFTLDNWSAHGVMYVIWRQRINSNDGRGWRDMADRQNGDITQNHFDHCHVSFREGAGGGGGGGGGSPILQQGSEGSAVSRLQQLLTGAGFPVPTTGTFGPLTDAAVRQFQSARGLTSDGVVGPQTWAALDKKPDTPAVPDTPTNDGRPTLRLDAEGPAVSRLQQLLTNAGFPCSADGSFGPQTESAVRKFQSSRGLESDGIVGARTWAALHGEG